MAPVLGIDNPRAPVSRNPCGLEAERGDVAVALASAEVIYDETFTTAAETNNPPGPLATVAGWERQRLSVRESTQWPMMVRRSLATVFGVPEDNVHVLVPYLVAASGPGCAPGSVSSRATQSSTGY